jgi:uncharacterized protein
MSVSPTYLGTVDDVKGSTISVNLTKSSVSGLVYVEGHGYRVGQLGSFVRIPLGYVDLFGVVSQVGAGAVPERLSADARHGDRWMTVQLVGEGTRHSPFRRGLSQYPTIGDTVHIVTEEDLSRIYGELDAPNFVRVGHLATSDAIPALVDINRLVTRHSAVVGTTGSGKSTTVAGILAALSDPNAFPSARIIVLDIHGEYAKALSDRATIFRINPNERKKERPLYIPYWAMTFDELLAVTWGTVKDDAGRGAIMEKISDLKSAALTATPREGITPDTMTVDSPVPFSIHTAWLDLHRLLYANHVVGPTSGQSTATEALLLGPDDKPIQPGDAMNVIPPKYRPLSPKAVFNSGSPLNIRRQIDALASRLRDPRFDFLFRPGEWCPNKEGVPKKDLDSLLADWIGGPRPIAILDLSGIPPTVLTDLVGVLLRIIYDALFWARDLSEGGRERPLLLVLEEAHSYLNEAGSGSAASSVRRIVKEGRKYGIGAMIVSQRPAEIDSTILSQCGTIFAMRLANSMDRGHVTSAAPDNLEGLFAMLPILRTGEAIIAGEAVQLPIRTLVDPPAPNRRPDSEDPMVHVGVVDANEGGDRGPGGWNRKREKQNYEEVVAVWRKQRPRSPRITDNQSVERNDKRG